MVLHLLHLYRIVVKKGNIQMQSSHFRRIIVGFVLCSLVGTMMGCGSKEEAAKPANGNYYTGDMKEKPKQDGAKKKMMGEGGEK